jgi:hypothetical protein
LNEADIEKIGENTDEEKNIATKRKVKFSDLLDTTPSFGIPLCIIFLPNDWAEEAFDETRGADQVGSTSPSVAETAGVDEDPVTTTDGLAARAGPPIFCSSLPTSQIRTDISDEVDAI